MNRHSIFFKLNLLFFLALVAALAASFFLWNHLQMKERLELRLKGRLLLQELRRGEKPEEETLRTLQLHPVKDPGILEKIRRERSARFRRHREHSRHRRFRVRLVRVGSEHYLLVRTPRGERLFAPDGGWWGRHGVFILVFGGVLLSLSLLYWMLHRSLEPLRILEEEIRRYGEGRPLLKRERFREGEDEISRLARAFYEAADRVERLGSSRRLFLRNILHELNTPVTKGKLLAEVSTDASTREMLHSIFDRLSLLLDELAQVERITASSEGMERRAVRIVDLIDQARDRLFLDDPISYEGKNVTILADFASLAIVMKNLIDNGLKYGQDFRMRLAGERLEFISRGEALAHPLEWYLQPFRKEGDSSGGFGLGLYIVSEILRRQGMDLRHVHRDGENIFSIGPLDFAA